MRRVLKYFLLILISFCAGLAGAISFYKVYQPTAKLDNEPAFGVYKTNGSIASASVLGSSVSSAEFIKASQVATPAVVYIKVQSVGRQQSPYWDPFFDFFGRVGPVSSSGSGVIISPDGYIVSNAHVVDKAEKIEIVMNNNKRSFQAKVIGTDPSSDLALLKIEAKDLPFLNFANSDALSIGEWVLAVGNPFNLTSTVTAGIVSARGRNINLVQNQFPIESFIQTDAAINPGNSGGALVNTEGKLVGINTAILSKTGVYAGYGFAIPANIVHKVVSDLKDFGYVQRAFIEAQVSDIDESVARSLTEDNLNGVYVALLVQGGNADKAGIRKGDLIIRVDDKLVDSRAVFDEQLAYHRPGDKVKMIIKRGKEVFETTVTMTNLSGTTSLEKTKAVHSQQLNADFEEVTKLEKERHGITNGFRLANVGNGPLTRMGLSEGFIITGLNGQSYDKASDLIQALEKASGKINIEGINSNGARVVYSFYSF